MLSLFSWKALALETVNSETIDFALVAPAIQKASAEQDFSTAFTVCTYRAIYI